MKRLLTISFAVYLAVVSALVAQDTRNHDDGQRTLATEKPIDLRGKISNTGQTFVTDGDGNSWTILNPDAVKGHEGQHVILTANVDADQREVTVASLKVLKQ
jgi:hypothetical protein